MLEGGYDLTGLAEGVHAVLDAVAESAEPEGGAIPAENPSVEKVIGMAVKRLGEFWDL